MSKVFVMDHPLIQHKIGWIRRKETGSKEFRYINQRNRYVKVLRGNQGFETYRYRN